ncbi:MAG TPA: phosphatidylserine decarboxylase [Xanthobacteraceae bacterium]|nr:phosphatidylserine decarboxylase [Xanthobacteraceae bacterium]
MSKPLPLPIWDRGRAALVEEWMDDSPQTYASEPTHSLQQWIRSQPLIDRLYAAFENSRFSARKIAPFIRAHRIDMSEFEPVQYRSFAEFFDRRFRPGARAFPKRAGEMGAFAEARYFGWETLAAGLKFPVKGYSLSAARILGSDEDARPFLGGPVLLARLSPMDYHHAHFPDAGMILDQRWIGGRLWTVNWHALQNKDDILFKNERQISELATVNFGRLAFVEIGALTVGRIVELHGDDTPFSRGKEKSVFRFGGSAIIVFGEPGAWRPSEDILANTQKGIETFVRLGETVAARI